MERAYAVWVVGAVRRMSPGSRFDGLRLPQVVASEVLVTAWFISLLGLLFSDDSAIGWRVSLLVTGVAFVVLMTWRIVGEAWPVASVLSYMVVMGSTVDEVPGSPSVRASAIRDEWERRVGAKPASMLPVAWAARRRHALVNWCGAAGGLGALTLVLLVADLDEGPSGWFWFVVSVNVVQLLIGLRAKRAADSQRAQVRSELALVFGEPLPPGPPSDPVLFREWVASTVAGSVTPTQSGDAE
jgi:hypothetical protein